MWLNVRICMCVCVCVAGMWLNKPVKIKAKVSRLTSTFLAAAAAANEKCYRHNLQHFLLFKFLVSPQGVKRWGMSPKKEAVCTYYHAHAHVHGQAVVFMSMSENIHSEYVYYVYVFVYVLYLYISLAQCAV